MCTVAGLILLAGKLFLVITFIASSCAHCKKYIMLGLDIVVKFVGLPSLHKQFSWNSTHFLLFLVPCSPYFQFSNNFPKVCNNDSFKFVSRIKSFIGFVIEPTLFALIF